LVIEALWEKIGLRSALTEIAKADGKPIDYERALFAMTANRLCEPESKLGEWDRWLSRVYLPSCSELKLDQMYEAMDFFHAHAAEIEETVFDNIAKMFSNIKENPIYYSTTIASLHIDCEDGGEQHPIFALRKSGSSKKSAWLREVVVGLAVTSEGIPVRSWILPGNADDVSGIKKIRADLYEWGLERSIFVCDSDFEPEADRSELAQACGKYLLACRTGNPDQIRQKVFGKRGPYTKVQDNLFAKNVIVGDGQRCKRYILYYYDDKNEATRQHDQREKIVLMLEKELSCHTDRTATAQWAIDLLESPIYRQYLLVTKGKKISMARAAIQAASKQDGKWVLETNDDELSFEDAHCGYKALMTIERCFRSLKRTQIKMLPMYHWGSRRIEAQIKICGLSMMIKIVAEHKTGMPWHQIHHALEELQVTKFSNLNQDLFMRNKITDQVNSILTRLIINAPPKRIA
jgi:transposase